MFTGTEIVGELTEVGVSHVIWVPDSELGRWETELESAAFQLVRVCREGEAWPLAAGLLLAGKTPLIMLQTTGLFESGDALRNVVHDMKLPVFALIGARNWLAHDSQDSAKLFARDLMDAWKIDWTLIQSAAEKPKLRQHYLECKSAGKPGAALLAE